MSESISELNRIWSSILHEVEGGIDDPKVTETFLGDSFLYSYDKGVMIVGVNSALAVKMLNDAFYNVINKAAKKVTGNDSIKIEFVLSSELKNLKVEEIAPDFFKYSTINDSLTFDTFITGECNLQAKQASLFIASNPGKMYNPLFIYGNSGLGKTHLLFAIANYIKSTNSSRKVLYCTSDEFIDEFVRSATGEKQSSKLKSFITSFDILLIDDIQFIGGRKQTEEFLFTIFTKMYSMNKQIVITSDRHPSDLKNFEERLRSRFASGLTISINRPDIDTCVSIIKSKIDLGPLDANSFDPEVFNFIASKFSKNVRSLDEALNKIVWHTTLFKPTKYISMDVAIEALQDLINVKDEKQRISETRIINVVAEYYSLNASDLTSTSRVGKITNARHIAIYLIRSILDVPYEKIGDTFGGKDHSTIMSSVKKVEKELKTNETMQKVIQDIKKELK